MYCIVAETLPDGTVTRGNYVATQIEADCIVNRLKGVPVTEEEKITLLAIIAGARAEIEGVELENFYTFIEEALNWENNDKINSLREFNLMLTDGQWRHITNRLFMPLVAEKQAPDIYWTIMPDHAYSKNAAKANSDFWRADKQAKTVVFNVERYKASVQDAAMWVVRSKRDALLTATDYKILPDSAESQTSTSKLAWIVYRQALRDLPANTADPANPVWPTKPGD